MPIAEMIPSPPEQVSTCVGKRCVACSLVQDTSFSRQGTGENCLVRAAKLDDSSACHTWPLLMLPDALLPQPNSSLTSLYACIFNHAAAIICFVLLSLSQSMVV